MAIINGTPGSDRLTGTVFDDFISGFDSNDVIVGSQGFDFIDGGDGFDTVNYTSLTESITLGPQGSVDKGSAGVDALFLVERVIAPRNVFNVIDASTAAAPVSINVSLRKSNINVRNIPGLGTISIEVDNFIDVVGTNQGDSIEGDRNSNFLLGLGGNDVFRGTEGFDLIEGGDGSDTVNYNSLTEAITLLPAGEIDKGSAGTDSVFEVERIIAPVGQLNLIDASSGTGGVSLNANLEKKTLFVRDIPGIGTQKIRVDNFVDVIGSNESDFIKGDSQDNFLSGEGGNDAFRATSGFDSISGGDGFDSIDYSSLDADIVLRPTGEVDKGFFGTDLLFRVEKIIGNVRKNNIVDASTSFDASIEIDLDGKFLNVSGIPGIPLLGFTIENFIDVIGTQVNDVIKGNGKSNFLDGQNGDDFFTATKGDDFIIGGDGFDTVDYSVLNTAITVAPAGVVRKGSSGTDTAFQVDRFIGAAGKANTVDGSTASSGISFSVDLSLGFLDVFNVPGFGTINQFVENFTRVIGTSGGDFIAGSVENNFLNGQGGNDAIFGSAGADEITGAIGNDFLAGEEGEDRINGTNSNARGQNEIDALLGGSGNDVFVLGDASGSFYKSNTFSDFDSFGFGGFSQVAFIDDFGVGDRIELGRGETYRAERTSTGFDLYVNNSGLFDAVAGVITTSFIGLPTGDFSLAAGQTLGAFVGA